MGSLEDLERRVGLLEDRVNMEAGLAASRDRDISEIQVTLRSHTAMLQAVNERLAEQGAILTAQGAILAAQGAKLDSHDAKLDSHDAKLDTVLTGQETIVGMLGQLIERDDEPPGAS